MKSPLLGLIAALLTYASPAHSQPRSLSLRDNQTGEVFFCSTARQGNGGLHEERLVQLGIFGDRGCRDHDHQTTIIYSSLEELKSECLRIGKQAASHLSDTEALKVNDQCVNTSRDGYPSVEQFAEECVLQVRTYFLKQQPRPQPLR